MGQIYRRFIKNIRKEFINRKGYIYEAERMFIMEGDL